MTTRQPVRILAIGPAPAGPRSRGGMASVMRLLREHPDPRFAITVIPTFVDTIAPIRLWTGIRGMLTATALILLGRTDIVHVHLSHGGSVVRKSLPLMAARLRGTPAIVHGHSFNFTGWLDPLPAPVRRLVRVALHADHWLVLGRSLAVQYRRCLHLHEDQIQVLYNPVVMPDIRHGQQHSSTLTVLTLGRLGHRKGTFDLVRAVELLPDDVRSQIQVVLAGDGEVDEVRAFVDARNLRSVIDVVGWIDAPTRDSFLQMADIFVLPSYDEGLPMAMLEAMAHGVVPLTTPVGSIPEAVTDDIDGLLVSPGDAAALADGLQRLVQDRDLRTQLSAAARERAAAFDVAAWRAELAVLWLRLAARRSG
ncbi:glycosyltransferase family 4 protein [Mycobacterium sp. 21AC1]|uniref:glycosyltransferase family 4 protein n=1 Tax=[Mycobacterium] appelbergii TaxID=2939269 RepID=UPI002938DDD2|nr:glycosyltransferase family 4 protein [Mycobacterium sp. 21AC1]MDV3125575.1 glycosyltransferase family 4 protein [Mycobacterium sp. 21AC1]